MRLLVALLSLCIFSLAWARQEEVKGAKNQGISLSLLPSLDCVVTDPCRKCTSENKDEPACKSTGYFMEYACNRTQIEGNSTIVLQESHYAACRRPLEVLQTSVSLMTVTTCMYAGAILGTIILFLSRNMKWMRGYRRIRTNSVA